MKYVACAAMVLALMQPLAAAEFQPKKHLLQLEFAFLRDPAYDVRGERAVNFNDADGEYALEGTCFIERRDKQVIDKKQLLQAINADLSRVLQKKIELKDAEIRNFNEKVQIDAYDLRARLDVEWTGDTRASFHYGAWVERTPKEAMERDR